MEGCDQCIMKDRGTETKILCWILDFLRREIMAIFGSDFVIHRFKTFKQGCKKRGSGRLL